MVFLHFVFGLTSEREISGERMIERDEMVFKWMEAVENELHSLGIDLNKIREIFFMKNNEEDIDE